MPSWQEEVKVDDEFGGESAARTAAERSSVVHRRGRQQDPPTTASQRQCLREATRGRCESGARGSDARVCQDQAGKAPLIPLTGPSVNGGTARGVPSDQEAPSQRKRSDGCKSQQSRRRAIRNTLRGNWLGQPRTLTAEQGHGARPQRRGARRRPGRSLETRTHTT